MTQDAKVAAKKRIFDAAVSLFARRGFSAVGIREIAKKADVNISMINYYFDGKAGILKEIINECYDKYYSTILDTGDEKTSLEERVKYLTYNMVKFFDFYYIRFCRNAVLLRPYGSSTGHANPRTRAL